MKVRDLLFPLEQYLSQQQKIGRRRPSPIENLETMLTMTLFQKQLATYQSQLDEPVTPHIVRDFQEMLEQRWSFIQSSDFEYTMSPDLPANQACLDLAKTLYGILKNETGPYGFLMPTITHTENHLTGTSFNDRDLELHHFIISEDCTRFIEISPTLEAFRNTQKWYYSDVAEPLDLIETRRVVNHSRYTQDYYSLIREAEEIKNGVSLGSLLEKLADALEKGGVHGRGEETNASPEAMLAIQAFSEKLTLMPVTLREKLFKTTITLFNDTISFKELWYDRLIPDKPVNLNDPRFCVDSNSFAIRKMLKQHPDLYDDKLDSEEIQKSSLQDLTKSLKEAEKTLDNALKDKHYNVQHIRDPLVFINKAVSNQFQFLNDQQKQSIFEMFHDDYRILGEIYKWASPSDRNQLLDLILHWNNADRIIEHFVEKDLLPVQTIMKICENNFLLLTDCVQRMTSEKKKEFLSQLDVEKLRTNINSFEQFAKLVCYLDQDLRRVFLNVIGISFIDEKFKQHPKESLSALITMLSQLPQDTQMDLLNAMGPSIRTAVLSQDKVLIGSDFKACFNKLKEQYFWNLHFYDPQSPNQHVRMEYDSFLKTMCCAYLHHRGDTPDEYAHKWGGLFGGVDKASKLEAATMLMQAIDGNPEALRVLPNYQKAFKGGDLGEIYNQWVYVKTNVYKEDLYSSPPPTISIVNNN